MSALAAAVAVLTVVTLLNLLLLGVVRRLRTMAAPQRPADPFGLARPSRSSFGPAAHCRTSSFPAPTASRSGSVRWPIAGC
ncbi:MAG TPA: hypothetical protein VH573_20250 [Mycobacteriales bacterium]